MRSTATATATSAAPKDFKKLYDEQKYLCERAQINLAFVRSYNAILRDKVRVLETETKLQKEIIDWGLV